MDQLINLVQSLPDELILNIFSWLPSSYIADFFFHLPSTRQLVINHYYSNELHFILAPPGRPHHCPGDAQRREIVDFNNYTEIDEFLHENPTVSPNILTIITGGDFRSLESLLEKYADRFLNPINQNQVLHIQIENYQFKIEDFDLIALFATRIEKLQITKSSLQLLGRKPQLHGYLAKFEHLKQIVLLGHGLTDWTHIKLPPNLTHFDASWKSDTNIHKRLVLPDSLEHLFWNSINLRDDVFNSKTFPPNLKTLMITCNKIEEVVVDNLPRTLETLDLLENGVSRFVSRTAGRGVWPPHLKMLLLSGNQISDDGLQLLTSHVWPDSLQTLKLDSNQFTTLEHLKDLPSSIEYLDIANNELENIRVILETKLREDGTYPYLQFPANLKTLNLCASCFMLRENDIDDEHFSFKIRFPSKLTNLNIDECNIKSLHKFSFPNSLTKLSICGNVIESINSYDDWESLVHLEKLELFYNRINSFENWLPPSNLKYLDVGQNLFEVLSSERTPLFQRHANHNLQLHTLKVETNHIRGLDPQMVLPPSLRYLLLRDNCFADEVEFPESFSRNSGLESLNLTSNLISEVNFMAAGPGECRLRSIDLSLNKIFWQGKTMGKIDSFYNDLEQSLGLKVTKRKANVNSMHEFETCQ